MPTYDYECTKCGHRFEYFQGMNDELLKKCPKCSSLLKRLMGAGAGVIFKGSGFYATDYKSKPEKTQPASCPKNDKDGPACKSCSTTAP